MGHELTAENRLDRILEMGEVIPKILSSGKNIVEKFFPGNPESLANLADLPAELDEATSFFDERLRSSARGGAKTALGLMMAHYPEAEAWRVASDFPLERRMAHRWMTKSARRVFTPSPATPARLPRWYR